MSRRGLVIYPAQYDDIWAEKRDPDPINLLMFKSFTENCTNSSEDITEKINSVQLDKTEDKEDENPHITGNEIPKNSLKNEDELECEKDVYNNSLKNLNISNENEYALDELVQIEQNNEAEIVPIIKNEESLENQVSLQ